MNNNQALKIIDSIGDCLKSSGLSDTKSTQLYGYYLNLLESDFHYHKENKKSKTIKIAKDIFHFLGNRLQVEQFHFNKSDYAKVVELHHQLKPLIKPLNIKEEQ